MTPLMLRNDRRRANSTKHSAVVAGGEGSSRGRDCRRGPVARVALPILVFACMLGGSTWGQVSTSTNYSIVGQVLAAGGGLTASSSYSAEGTVGEFGVGPALNSTNFTAFGGVVFAGGGVMPPIITSVSPNKGPKSGGTLVTVTGMAFGNLPYVGFDGQFMNFVGGSGNTRLVVTPPGTSANGNPKGAVVVSPGTTGVGVLSEGFTYLPALRLDVPLTPPLGGVVELDSGGANVYLALFLDNTPPTASSLFIPGFEGALELTLLNPFYPSGIIFSASGIEAIPVPDMSMMFSSGQFIVSLQAVVFSPTTGRIEFTNRLSLFQP